jgi:hypothetical protein
MPQKEHIKPQPKIIGKNEELLELMNYMIFLYKSILLISNLVDKINGS